MSNKLITLRPGTDLLTSIPEGMTPQEGGPPALLYLAGLAPTGRKSMRSALKVIADMVSPGVELEELPWWKLRFAHVQAIRARLVEKYAPRSVNRMLAALRGVLTVCWNLNLIPGEEFQKAVKVKCLPRDAQPPAGRALSEKEIDRLLKACERDPLPPRERVRAAAILALLYGAGLRADEAVRLNLEDYDDAALSFKVRGKRGKIRLTYLHKRFSKYVDAWVERWRSDRDLKTGPFFVRFDRNGRPIEKRLGYTGLVAALKKVQELEKIEFTAHDLRRSFGTRLLDKGADLLTVMKLMGHADVATTAIYDRRGETEKRRVVDQFMGDD